MGNLRLLVFALIAFTTSFSAASPIEKRFLLAQSTQKIVGEFKNATISNDFKKSLLDHARAEDKAFVKSSVIHWKSYNDRNIHAEFDELVLTTDDGFEVMRVKMQSEPASTFLINGQAWTAPEKGSIEKSLRAFLKSNQADRSFDARRERSNFATILSPAAAFAAPAPVDILPAYVYVIRGLEIPRTVTEYLEGKSPAPFLTGPAKEAVVHCQGASAKGQAKLGLADIQFESKSDGSLILTLADKSKLVVQSKTIDDSVAKSNIERLNRDVRENKKTEEQVAATRAYYQSQIGKTMNLEALTVRKCAQADCAKVDDSKTADTLLPWLPRPTPPAIEKATKWKPDNSSSTARIVSEATPDGSIYHRITGGPVATSDQVTIRVLIDDADAAARDERRLARNLLLSLRPLGACCGLAACRTQLEKEKVHLTPNASEATGK